MNFRPMRRVNQHLDEAECLEILKTAKRGVLAVTGDGGYPYPIPMNFVYEDGKIYFHSAMAGHKIDAIGSGARASFSVLDEGWQEPGDWWYHFRSVIVFGQADIMEDRAVINEKLRLLGNKYFPDADYTEREMKSAPRVAMIRLTIEHMTGKHVKEQ